MYKEAKINFITLSVLFLIIVSVVVLADQSATISKFEQNSGINPGEFARFLISVNNTGNETLTDMDITDIWDPLYFIFASYETSDGFTKTSNSSNNATWTLTLANNTSPAQMWVNFTATNNGTTTNSVTLDHSNGTELDSDNDLFTINGSISTQPNLTISKTLVGSSPVENGTNVTFVLSVSNVGMVEVEFYLLNESYDGDYLDYIDGSTTVDFQNRNELDDTIGWEINLTAGSNFTVNVTFLTVSNGTTTNEISLHNDSGDSIETDDVSLTITLPVTCGDTITSSITLTEDLTNCAGNGLIVGANDITIDCGGYSIDGDFSGNGNGFQILSKENVEIKNCEIYGFQQGLYVNGANNLTIEDNDIHNNNVSTARGIAIDAISSNITIKNNLIVDNHYHGLRVDSVITDLVITGNTFGGYHICNQAAIYLSANAIEGIIYNNNFSDNVDTECSFESQHVSDSSTGIVYYNISEIESTNIIGGQYISGNYWDDYQGEDMDGDGLGDTETPYNSSDLIDSTPGGDYAPLTEASTSGNPLETDKTALSSMANYGDTITFIINVTNNYLDSFNHVWIEDDFNETEIQFVNATCYDEFNNSEGWVDINLTDCFGELENGTYQEVELNFTVVTMSVVNTTNNAVINASNGTGSFQELSDADVELRGDGSTETALCIEINSGMGHYKLTKNLTTELEWKEDYTHDCFHIKPNADNTIIDCQGHSIIGNESSANAFLIEADNVTIKNCIIEDVKGVVNADTINGLNFTNNTVYNAGVNEGSSAFALLKVNGSTFTNNLIDMDGLNQTNGFEIQHAFDNDFMDNLFRNLPDSGDSYQMLLFGNSGKGSHGNLIENNNFINVTIGVKLDTAMGNEIISNIFNNGVGVSTRSIYLTSNSTGNEVYDNLLRHNESVYDYGTNYWNTTTGGNNWTGYKDVRYTCVDAGSDGFCDQPFYLAGSGANADYMPYYLNSTESGQGGQGGEDVFVDINYSRSSNISSETPLIVNYTGVAPNESISELGFSVYDASNNYSVYDATLSDQYFGEGVEEYNFSGSWDGEVVEYNGEYVPYSYAMGSNEIIELWGYVGGEEFSIRYNLSDVENIVLFEGFNESEGCPSEDRDMNVSELQGLNFTAEIGTLGGDDENASSVILGSESIDIHPDDSITYTVQLILEDNETEELETEIIGGIGGFSVYDDDSGEDLIASLIVSKTLLTQGTIEIGDSMSFLVNLTNNGTANLSDAWISDNFNNTFINFIEESSCGFDGWNNSVDGSDEGYIDINVSACFGGDLNPGQSYLIYLNFTATGAGDNANLIFAYKNYSDFDGDINYEENNSIFTITNSPSPVNVTIIKTATPSSVENGDIANFMINITNHGDNLSGYTIYDSFNNTYLRFNDATIGNSNTSDSVEWLINISAGENLYYYVNFTTHLVGNTTNFVEFQNLTEQGFGNYTTNLTITSPSFCLTPTNGMNISESSTLCEGSYYLSEEIHIVSNNLVLTCNQTRLYSSVYESGEGIDIDGRFNISIGGCLLSNFSTTIEVYDSRDLDLSNLNVSYSGSEPLYFNNVSDSRIYNSYFYSEHTGVEAYTNSNNNLIFNNTFVNSLGGIDSGRPFYMDSGSTNNTIYHNNMLGKNDPYCNDSNNWNYNNEGNYWSYFNCSDVNQDGFCDADYLFNHSSDNYSYYEEDGWTKSYTPIMPFENATILKTTVNSSIEIGDMAQFIINITNTGTDNLTLMEVRDDWNISMINYSSSYSPNGAEITQADPVYNESEVFWYINLSVGESGLISVNFTTLNTGNTTNNVDIENSTGGTFDSDYDVLEIRNSSIPFSPSPVNVTIIKTATPSSVENGDIANFMINITNHGDNLSGYTIYDSFNNTYLRFNDATIGNSNTSDSVEWLINISAGENLYYYVNFTTLVIGNTTNEVYFQNSSQYDFVNDTANLEITTPFVAPALVENATVVKVAESSIFEYGEDILFRINVTNTGTANLTNAEVRDSWNISRINYTNSNTLSSGVTTGIPDYNESEMFWYVNLTPGQSAIIYANFTSLSLGNTTNEVDVEKNETINLDTDSFDFIIVETINNILLNEQVLADFFKYELLEGQNILGTSFGGRIYRSSNLSTLSNSSLDYEGETYFYEEMITIGQGALIPGSAEFERDYGTQPRLVVDRQYPICYDYKFNDPINLSNDEDLNIEFLGEDLTIYSIGQEEVTLSNLDPIWMDYNSSVIELIDGINYEVFVRNIYEDEVLLTVNGVTKKLYEGDSKTFGFDNFELNVLDILDDDGVQNDLVKLIYGSMISETARDGSSAEMLGYGDDDDEAEWVWNINSTSEGILNSLGVCYHQDRDEIEEELDEDWELPVLSEGDSLYFPNDFVEIQFVTVNHNENNEQLTIEYDDSFTFASDESEDGMSNSEVWKLLSDEEIISYEGQEYTQVYILNNLGESGSQDICFRDSEGNKDCEDSFNSNNLAIKVDDDSLNLNFTYSSNVLISIALENIASYDGSSYVNDLLYTPDLNCESDSGELNISYLDISFNEEDFITDYGIIIETPESNLEDCDYGKLVLQIPEEAVNLDILISSMDELDSKEYSFDETAQIEDGEEFQFMINISNEENFDLINYKFTDSWNSSVMNFSGNLFVEGLSEVILTEDMGIGTAEWSFNLTKNNSKLIYINFTSLGIGQVNNFIEIKNNLEEQLTNDSLLLDIILPEELVESARVNKFAIVSVFEFEIIEDELNLGTSFFGKEYDDWDIDLLSEGELRYGGEYYDYEEMIILNSNALIPQSSEYHSSFGGNPYLIVNSDNQEGICYEYYFEDPFDSILEGEDFEINFLDSNIQILEINKSSNQLIIDSISEIWLNFGDEVTVLVEGENYSINFSDLSDSEGTLYVNGVSQTLIEGQKSNFTFEDFELKLIDLFNDGSDENDVIHFNYGKTASETIASGNTVKYFGDESNNVAAEWVWDLNITSSGLNWLGVCYNQDRNESEGGLDEDWELPALLEGDEITFPNNFASIEFLESNNLEDMGEITFEYSEGLTFDSDDFEDGINNSNVWKLSSDEEMIYYGGQEYTHVYILNNLSESESQDICFEDSHNNKDCENIFNTSNLFIELDDETLNLNIVYISNILASISLEHIAYYDGDSYIHDLVYTPDLNNEANIGELNISNLDISSREDNFMTDYGVIIENPKDNLESGEYGKLVLQIPEEAVTINLALGVSNLADNSLSIYDTTVVIDEGEIERELLVGPLGNVVYDSGDVSVLLDSQIDYNNSNYDYEEKIILENGALIFESTEFSETYGPQPVLRVDSNKLLCYRLEFDGEINLTSDWLNISFLGKDFRFSNSSLDKVIVSNLTHIQLVEDGSSAEMLGYGDDNDEAEWVWNINSTSEGILNSLGVCYNQDRDEIEEELDEDWELPVLSEGDSLYFPNDFVEIQFATVNHNENNEQLTIEYDDSFTFASDESEDPKLNGAEVYIFEAYEEVWSYEGMEYEKFIVTNNPNTDNNGNITVCFKDSNGNKNCDLQNFDPQTLIWDGLGIKLDDEVLDLEIKWSGNLSSDELLSISLMDVASYDGTSYLHNLVYTPTLDGDSDDPNELVLTSGKNLSNVEEDFMLDYGVIVNTPEGNLEGGDYGKLVLQIPEEAITADLSVGVGSPQVNYGRSNEVHSILTNFEEEIQFIIRLTNDGTANLTNIKIVDEWNSSYLNFTGNNDIQGVILSSLNVDEGIGIAEWLVNLSVGDTINLYTNFTAMDIGDTTNHVKIYNFTKDVIFSLDSVNITIQDIVNPSLDLKGILNWTIEVNTNYTEPGASSYDNYCGNLTSNISIDDDNLNMSKLGEYEVYYGVEDSSGNHNETTRIVNVVDTTSPNITLINNAIINLELNELYTEYDATATDNYDGDITENILIDNSSVNTSMIGVYIVTYNVTDSSGNSNETNRTVNVVDTQKPTFDAIPENVTLEYQEALFVDFNSSDNSGNTNYSINETTNFQINQDGELTNKTLLDLGNYSINVTIFDASGNENFAIFNVSVVDTTNPSIVLNGSANLTLEINTIYVEYSANVSDNYDPSLTILNNNETVNMSKVDIYIVTYNVTDSSGNFNSTNRTVNIVDTTKPSITIENTTLNFEVGSSYVEQGATATDNYDPSLTILNNNETVNMSKVDIYIVTYNVTDSSGNFNSTNRTVNVVDTTIPVITLIENATLTLEVGSSYIEYNANATDNYDNDLTNNISIDNSSVNMNVLGSYTVYYNVTDSSGNFNSTNRTVNVVDTTDPTVTLNTASGYSRTNRVYLNFSAEDNADPILSCELYVDGVNQGTYAVDNGSSRNVLMILSQGNHTWNVSCEDDSGNSNTSETRWIFVDSIKPITNMNYNNSADSEWVNSPTFVNFTVVEAGSGNSYTQIINSNNSWENVTNGFTLAESLGDNKLYYRSVDLAGNIELKKQKTFKFDNVNPTTPVIKLSSNEISSTGSISVEVSSSDALSGLSSTADYIVLNGTVEISSGNLTYSEGKYFATISAPEAEGAYNISIVVSDLAGNTVTDATNQFNVDNTVATITVDTNNGTFLRDNSNVVITINGINGWYYYNNSGTEINISNGSTTVQISGADADEIELWIYANNTAGTVNQNYTYIIDELLDSISITAPTNEEIVNKTVTINATATDNGAGVESVFFTVTKVGANTSFVTNNDTVSPYSFNMDTLTAEDGNYSITAVATDYLANTKTTTIYVTINNTEIFTNLISDNAGELTEEDFEDTDMRGIIDSITGLNESLNVTITLVPNADNPTTAQLVEVIVKLNITADTPNSSRIYFTFTVDALANVNITPSYADGDVYVYVDHGSGIEELGQAYYHGMITKNAIEYVRWYFDTEDYSIFYLGTKDNSSSSPPPPPTEQDSPGGNRGGPPSSCTPTWECGEWSECIEGQQTRVCVDKWNCSADDEKPEEIQACSIEESIPEQEEGDIEEDVVELPSEEVEETVVSNVKSYWKQFIFSIIFLILSGVGFIFFKRRHDRGY